MFSGIKIEEYKESELADIFWVKLIAKNIVLGSSGTHFMHMRVKEEVQQNFLDDHRQTILRHFQVLVKLFFTLNRKDLDFYHQKVNVRVAL